MQVKEAEQPDEDARVSNYQHMFSEHLQNGIGAISRISSTRQRASFAAARSGTLSSDATAAVAFGQTISGAGGPFKDARTAVHEDADGAPLTGSQSVTQAPVTLEAQEAAMKGVNATFGTHSDGSAPAAAEPSVTTLSSTPVTPRGHPSHQSGIVQQPDVSFPPIGSAELGAEASASTLISAPVTPRGQPAAELPTASGPHANTMDTHLHSCLLADPSATTLSSAPVTPRDQQLGSARARAINAAAPEIDLSPRSAAGSTGRSRRPSVMFANGEDTAPIAANVGSINVRQPSTHASLDSSHAADGQSLPQILTNSALLQATADGGGMQHNPDVPAGASTRGDSTTQQVAALGNKAAQHFVGLLQRYSTRCAHRDAFQTLCSL